MKQINFNENLDDKIIPPPPEFTDIPQINNIIYIYIIYKQGPPQSNPIQYILEEQNNIMNYLNEFHSIKYQIELKVIFVNINDIELTSNS